MPPATRRRRVSAKHKVTVVLILVLYTAILSAVTYFMFYKPKSDDKQFVEYMTDEHGNVVEVTHDYDAVEGQYNILLLGHDKEAMLTDVAMLLNVNNNDGTVTVMQIPRDTYVSSVDGVGISTNKFNELFINHYNYHIRDGKKSEKAYSLALESVADLLSDSLRVNIDFAAIMDLAGFRNIVNAIGGVEINVPEEMKYYDPEQDLTINIPAGYQTLNGDMAEGFVRYRVGYLQGDLGRVNAQKLFLMAFFNKVKSSISLTNVSMLTELAGEVSNNLETNLGVSDIVYFARCALSLDTSRISMLTLPGQTNSTHYVMNKKATLEIVNKYFNTFDKDITLGLFDAKGQFNDADDPYVNGLYTAEPDELYDGNIYSGDGIENGEIDIPRA